MERRWWIPLRKTRRLKLEQAVGDIYIAEQKEQGSWGIDLLVRGFLPYPLAAVEEGDTLRIASCHPPYERWETGVGTEMHLQIPPAFPLSLRLMVGNVRVETGGEQRVTVAKGDIYARSFGQTGFFSSLVGNICVDVKGDFQRLEVRGRIGHLTITLPSNASLFLQAQTQLGKVCCEQRPAPPFVPEEEPGDLFQYRLGTGDKKVRLQTGRGNITILFASEKEERKYSPPPAVPPV